MSFALLFMPVQFLECLCFLPLFGVGVVPYLQSSRIENMAK